MNQAAEPEPKSLASRTGSAIARYVPIVRWLPAYRHADLAPDAIAGLTSWAIMVPVALAYASLAGLPPEYGLITAFAALAAYAVFGTSRQLKVTTSSTMAVMSFSLVAPLAGGDASRFVALSAALALIVGAILVLAGFLRLGFISEFLAKPVVTGFITGVAITIIVGQLPKLLGVPGVSGSVPDQLVALAGELAQTDPLTLAVGLLSLAIIGLLRRFAPRLPGSLIATVVGILLVVAFDLDALGVAVVGFIPTGLHGFGLPDVGLSDLTYLLAGAAGLVFLVVGESLSAARTLARRHREEIDADQELVALGAANSAAGLFGGFVVDASLSQSAAADEAGARTQVASLLTSALVLLTVLFLAPLFQSLPMATLAAVVIAAAIGLIDLHELRRYWAWRRTDALLAVAALIGVATTDVLAGLMIAVLLSLLLLLYRASRPYLAVVARLPGDREVFADVSRHPDAEAVPGLLLLRMDAPLYFFNVSVARTQILELVNAQEPMPSVVVIDLGATADLDVTTTDMLAQLIGELEERGIALSLVQAKGAVRDRLVRTGLMSQIGAEHIHFSMAQAVAVEEDRRIGSPLSVDTAEAEGVTRVTPAG
jgi:high affinity sulfate transporter 1